jgi:hypothetical protein
VGCGVWQFLMLRISIDSILCNILLLSVLLVGDSEEIKQLQYICNVIYEKTYKLHSKKESNFKKKNICMQPVRGF